MQMAETQRSLTLEFVSEALKGFEESSSEMRVRGIDRLQHARRGARTELAG